MASDISSIDFSDDELTPSVPDDLRGLSEGDDRYDELRALAEQSAEALVALDDFPEAEQAAVADAIVDLTEYLHGPELLRGVAQAFEPADDSPSDEPSGSTGEFETVTTAEFEANALDGDANVDVAGELLVDDISDHDSDSIALVATVGNDDGSFRLTVFQTSYDKDPTTFDPLQEGTVITAEGITTDEYNGYINAKAFQSAEFDSVADPDLDAAGIDTLADDSVEITGPVSEIRNKYSGLVEDCPTEDCRLTVTDGECPNCGSVEPDSHALQIAGVLDRDSSRNFYIDTEAVKAFIGLTVEEVREEARDRIDPDWLADELSERLTGRYIRIEGSESAAGNISVTDFNLVASPPSDVGDTVAQYAREPEPRFSLD